MKKYPLPISIPKGHFIVQTQPYGDKSTVDWYKANGVNLTEHNGSDLVVSFPGATAQQSRFATYGAKLVCPTDKKAYLSKAWWDNPMSTKGNGIQITWEEDGKDYTVRFWHCSEIVQKNLYAKEDVLGYIGNSGLVRPAPSPECAHCGAHLHLMLYVNGVLTDPMEVFDLNQWFTSTDSGIVKDLPPIIYYLKSIWDKLLGR